MKVSERRMSGWELSKRKGSRDSSGLYRTRFVLWAPPWLVHEGLWPTGLTRSGDFEAEAAFSGAQMRSSYPRRCLRPKSSSRTAV